MFFNLVVTYTDSVNYIDTRRNEFVSMYIYVNINKMINIFPFSRNSTPESKGKLIINKFRYIIFSAFTGSFTNL